MRNLKLIIPILAALAILGISAFIALPTFAHGASKPVIQCHYQIAGHAPCSNKPIKIIPLYQHSVPLTFDASHWSQQVWVPANFGLAYICDGASPNDALAIEDEYNLPHGETAWAMAIPHLHIVCDDQWHGYGVNWRYAHMIVVGSTRGVTVIVER